MIITSLNLNGLANAAPRGILNWLKSQQADIICWQDIRISEAQFPFGALESIGFNAFVFDAQEPSQGGTAILCRDMPKAVIRGIGIRELDERGAFLQADFDDVSVASMMFPKAPDEQSLQDRFDLQRSFLQHCKKTSAKRRDYIYCASLMMAHQSTDIGRWQERQHEPGCRPEERNFMDMLLGPAGFSDALRMVNKKDGQYSYWPLDETRELGCRFDYQLITPKLRDSVLNAQIAGDIQLSPHRPVTVRYEFQRDFF